MLPLIVASALGAPTLDAASTCAANWPGGASTCVTAVAVCLAESSGNCNAKYVNSGGSVDRGLWQVNNYWHKEVSDSCAYDCACNGKAASSISSGGSDWTPWSTFKTGAYKSHISEAQSACGALHTQQAVGANAMSEEAFLAKWSDVVMRVDGAPHIARRSLQAPGGNPFDMLLKAIQGITGAWQSIVNAFKSEYSEQIEDKEFANGWSKFKEATKVFKGAGLDYAKVDEFFSDIQSMIGVPSNYKDDFNQQIAWIKFFDNITWSEHNTQFNQGKGGEDTMFTFYARNRQSDSKLDVLFLTCKESFKLADNYFVISEHKSILGGLFSSTKLKFKKVPAGIQDKDLTFVSEYFSLLAYQQIAIAEGVQAPPDPSFPPAMAATS